MAPKLRRQLRPGSSPRKCCCRYSRFAPLCCLLLTPTSRALLDRSAFTLTQLRRFDPPSNFRAGIEAGISCFKRVYGAARCTWRGLDHFKAYIWSAVVAHNLVLFARLKLA
jgi:hypothetical protein